MAFPALVNTAPGPSAFFAQNLQNAPLPTNSPWQNFVLNNSNQPEYIHPYLLRASNGSLAISYPDRVVQQGLIYQAFFATLILAFGSGSHIVSRFDDLSVTLELPGPAFVPLVRGSPYITFIVKGGDLRISSKQTVVRVSPNDRRTKHEILFDSGQSWLIYSSSALYLSNDLSVSGSFRGIIRVAVLPGGKNADAAERILDGFSTAYPVSGRADLISAFRVQYEWEKRGWGELLMLSHPVHRQILAYPPSHRILPDLSYRSIDGELLGVVGDLWILEESSFHLDWYSAKGFDLRTNRAARNEVIAALEKDVNDLQPVNTSASYFYGKAIARAARFALIAEEIQYPKVIPQVEEFLQKYITPWLDGSFQGNGFGYDKKWGGLITRNGAQNSTADFGLGVYNDHHFHFGYFCYATAVLAKLNHSWALKFKPQVLSIVHDFVTVSRNRNQLFPRLRNFDLWTLHSWASGITEFPNGRNQESTSEAVNAYYSVALLGLAYGDIHLASTGSTLAALEIRSAKALWHVPSNSTLYEPEFVKENRVVGILWANKRDTQLWFAPAEWRECRLGIQVLPILPITELLFSDVDYAKELVDWTIPALSRQGVAEGWKGFLYALQATYDWEGALAKTRSLQGYDDGNSLSNLLWWIYTRASG